MPEFGYVLGNTTVVLLIVIWGHYHARTGEEQRQKTDQLLFTAPVKVGRIVLGKFLAILTVFAAPLIILAACPLVLSSMGRCPERILFLFPGILLHGGGLHCHRHIYFQHY